jgi:hypothetical protein
VRVLSGRHEPAIVEQAADEPGASGALNGIDIAWRQLEKMSSAGKLLNRSAGQARRPGIRFVTTSMTCSGTGGEDF